jgi:replication factor C subunit 2/4
MKIQNILPSSLDNTLLIENKNCQIPLVEKYRPRNLEDFVGNEDTLKCLNDFLLKKDMPNLILVGPPGTGKTSSILFIARKILGDKIGEYLMELNASDDRGIDVVRNRIKTFSQNKIEEGLFKIVILDEADNMTNVAQQALRRTFELYSGNTRFVMTCNQSNQIIEPIQSRCTILYFSKLKNDMIGKRLRDICKMEKIKFNNEIFDYIAKISNGDMRQAINYLQLAIISGAKQKLDKKLIEQICECPISLDIEKFIRIKSKEDGYNLINNLKKYYDNGYSLSDLIYIIFQDIIVIDMDKEKRLLMLEKIGDVYVSFLNGNESIMQLDNLLVKLMKILI